MQLVGCLHCNSSLTTLVGGILASMADDYTSINEAENTIKNALTRINSTVESGCGYDFELTRSYLERSGFDIVCLKDFEVELGPSNRKNLSNQRDGLCQVVDYSIINIDQKPVIDYLNNSDFNQIEKRIVILSHEDLSQELRLESVLEEELGIGAEGISNTSCDATFVIFFLGKNEKGEDYLGIGMKIKNDPSSFEYLSFEEYKDRIDNYEFENLEAFKRISFRTHDLVKNNLGHMELFLMEYAANNSLSILSLEWFAGLASGVIDGFIELVDIGAILLQAAWGYEASILNLSRSPTSSVAFLADLCYFRLKANSIKDAFKLKISHDLNVTLTIDKFIENISKITLDQIFDSVAKMLKDTVKNLLFLEGVFEQGYTIGKLVFEYIGAVFTGGTSTLSSALMRAKNLDEILVVFIKEGKDAIAKNSEEVISRLTTKLDNLYNIIKDLPNLKNWYLNGMNLFIKGELFLWSKDVRFKHLLVKLEDKLKDDPNFVSYFAENGLFKMKAYKKLQMGFPNFNPCFH